MSRARWIHTLLLPVAGCLLLALGCDSGNPVLPSEPTTATDGSTGGGSTGSGSGSTTYTVTLAANPAVLSAGSTTGSTITLTAVDSDGAAPADGSTAVVSTSLGNFGVDASGAAIQVDTLTLSGGSGTTTLFADTADVGTAAMVGQFDGTSATLNVQVVDSATAPAASFDFQIDSGLGVTFADTSTNTPTAWAWDFGDNRTSTAQNPTHTYRAEGSYVVQLTASNDAGSGTVNQIITVPAGETPTAAFAYTANNLVVNFADASTGNPTSWAWDFGESTSSDNTSTLQNPTHEYAAAGNYTVQLTATNSLGSSTINQVLTITDGGTAPTAAFSQSINGLTVTFADASTGTPTAWAWDFGDGNASTEQNPSHTYTASGDYTVQLTVTNSTGSSSANALLTVGEAPVASFTSQTVGLQAIFTDTSTNSPTTYLWDFGDGSGTSALANPSYTYATEGIYVVNLTVSNSFGSSSDANAVRVISTPTADFTFQVNGRNVIFTDASTGPPSIYAWDFGDGVGTSAVRDPAYCFDQTGDTFTVTLTVSNSEGSDSTSQFVTVTGDASDCP